MIHAAKIRDFSSSTKYFSFFCIESGDLEEKAAKWGRKWQGSEKKLPRGWKPVPLIRPSRTDP